MTSDLLWIIFLGKMQLSLLKGSEFNEPVTPTTHEARIKFQLMLRRSE